MDGMSAISFAIQSLQQRTALAHSLQLFNEDEERLGGCTNRRAIKIHSQLDVRKLQKGFTGCMQSRKLRSEGITTLLEIYLFQKPHQKPIANFLILRVRLSASSTF